MNKIVTICGSMKFKDKMMEVAKDLVINNKYIVLQCIYSNDKFSESEQQILADLHYNKIEISDAIYVINVKGYIGSSTSKEIEYAKKLGKEIMYLEVLIEKLKQEDLMTAINIYDKNYSTTTD